MIAALQPAAHPPVREGIRAMAKKPEVSQVFDLVDPATLVRNAQIRVDRNEQDDKELQESIAMYGVVLPIVVRKVEGAYHVIDGHRRTEMAIAASQMQVPVYIRPVDHEGEVAALQLIANISGRSDMSLKDQAGAVHALYTGPAEGSATLVAEMLGKSRSWVSKMLMLSKPNSTVARRLLSSEKLADLEVAYLLCRIEEIDPAEAELIYKEYAAATRASIKAVLDRLTKNGKPPAETPVNPETPATPETPEGSAAEKGEKYIGHAIEFDRDDLTLLKSILADAIVPAGMIERLAALRAVVADTLAEAAE